MRKELQMEDYKQRRQRDANRTGHFAGCHAAFAVKGV